ncbi:MAG: hypothetical protein JRJ56_04450, partial [Deltaproteobacteria bacterium]|nr:hypothetical protein [Deltaproteobacteria bacterium]
MKKLLQVSLSMLFVFLLLAGPARAATIQLSPADFEHWSAATLERGLYTQEDINSFIDDFCADKAGGSSLLSFLDGSLYYSLHRTADGYGSNGNGKRIGTALESLAA